MGRELDFKNWAMVEELDVAGTFIYNAIKSFDNMKHFHNSSEIFNVLYNSSVGIERLQKIIIILYEDTSIKSSEEIEKSLITHSHQMLNERINIFINCSFTNVENEFIQMLSNFYKRCRYDRFNFNTSYDLERELFVNFFNKNLQIDIKYKEMILIDSNDIDKKNFFNRIIGKISRKYYDIIYDKCNNLNIFAYELRTNSPAYKVFMYNRYNKSKNPISDLVFDEKLALKELLIFCINNKEESNFIDYIKEIEPIEFDIALIPGYLENFLTREVDIDLISDVEGIYDNFEINISERVAEIEPIGNSRYYFD